MTRRLTAPLVLAIIALAVVACDRVIELTPALPDGNIQPDAAELLLDGPDPDAAPDAGEPDSNIDAALGVD